MLLGALCYRKHNLDWMGLVSRVRLQPFMVKKERNFEWLCYRTCVEQGWHSGESRRLLQVCAWFDSRLDCSLVLKMGA